MSGKTTYEEQLAGKRTLIHITVGDSMEPLLYNRDTRVVIRGVDGAAEDLGPGDLPLYRRPTGQYVLHRIIRAESGFYDTRGDNRCGLEHVPREWVIGVVTEIYRKNRHIRVTDRDYLFYVKFWMASYPLRWPFYQISRRLRRWKRQ